MLRITVLGIVLALSALSCLSGCGGSFGMQKAEQGIAGTLTTYGPPLQLEDCSPLKTQFQKDSCRHDNERVVEMPFQGTLLIRNLNTRKTFSQTLDEQGSYRARLDPGNYEVCVNDECSDPLEVHRGVFAIYGQRLPRAAPADKSAARKDSSGAATP